MKRSTTTALSSLAWSAGKLYLRNRYGRLFKQLLILTGLAGAAAAGLAIYRARTTGPHQPLHMAGPPGGQGPSY